MKVRNIARPALLLLAVCGLLAAPATALGKEGWGPRKDYIGRYHVNVSQGGKLGVRGGQLNLFIQEEFPGSQEPAGILKLVTRTGRTDLVYLTNLHHRGARRSAEIHGGLFIGPKIGAFAGLQRKPGVIRATFTTRGLGTVRAVFVRFSAKPTP